MSVELPYVVRVYWDNGRGFARHIGVHRVLNVQPVIDGLPRWTMLDYIPQVIAIIQPYAERVRDMESREQRNVARWLEELKGLW
jgi:hypothetical protein